MLGLLLPLPWSWAAVVAAGAGGAGVAQFVAETLVFLLLRSLEARGTVRRFSPSTPMQESFKLRNFLAASLSHVPLFAVVASRRQEVWDKAQWGVPSALDVWMLALLLMVGHDAWFFATHSLLHRHKGLYRLLHAPHHRVTTELGPFSTSDAEPLEFMVDWAGFYTLLVPLLLPFTRSWSPVALGLALVPCGLVNVLGHCGYQIPLWLGAVLSYGMLLLPGAQSPETHYIHHIDPRFNRSLYFTWCDRAAGTFRATHPAVQGGKHAAGGNGHVSRDKAG